jgi:hypothetical protein
VQGHKWASGVSTSTFEEGRAEWHPHFAFDGKAHESGLEVVWQLDQPAGVHVDVDPSAGGGPDLRASRGVCEHPVAASCEPALISEVGLQLDNVTPVEKEVWGRRVGWAAGWHAEAQGQDVATHQLGYSNIRICSRVMTNTIEEGPPLASGRPANPFSPRPHRPTA